MSNAKAITATIDNGILTLAFGNGNVLTVDPSKLSEEIRNAAMLHGLKQKLVDAAAISRNPETGKSATLQDKFDAVNVVYERITAADGTWNAVTRTGGTGGSIGLLASALIRMTGKTADAIAEFLDSKTDKEQAALRANPKVAAVIAEIKAERAAKKAAAGNSVDTDDMLAELDI